jgi:hypothetical protein
MNEWILYLQKAYTCYSIQTYIYTCNTMTKSREQLNTLYIDEFGADLTTVFPVCSSIVVNTVIVTAGNFEP